MPSTPRATTRFIARLAILVVLASIVAFVVGHHGMVDDLAAGALTAAAVVGALACLVLARRPPRFVPLLTALSYIGVAWPVLWLRSLPEDSAAIPIGQVGAMFLSLIVMATMFFLLPGDETAPYAGSRLTPEGR